MAGMENMRAVAVHVDSLHGFGVDVSGDMAAFFNYEAGFTRLRHLMRKTAPYRPAPTIR